MKNILCQPDIMKRKLLTLIASAPLFAACSANSGNLSTDPEDVRLRKKFRGIYGVVLRIDAATPKKYITITSEAGREIDSPGSLALNKVGNLTYTDNSMPIPKVIRVIWREGAVRFLEKGQGTWSGDTIIGDYTVPVAGRIPDEVLGYIRSDKREPYWVGKSVHDGSDVFATPIGRALRLKIRLSDDGVLIGWDVEERIRTKFGTGLKYKLAGGDFREAQILDGKVIDPGWQK